MTRLALSARDRRTAVAGMSVVASLITFSRGLPALGAWERARLDAAADAAGRAASASALARMLPALRDSLTARRQLLVALDSTMLNGGSSAAVAADLAAAVEEIAADSRLKVTSMQLRADSVPAGSLARVSVRVAGTSDVAGLASFLHSAEGGAVPLIVRELSVSQPEPAAPDAKPETLHIDVLVETIARIERPRGT